MARHPYRDEARKAVDRARARVTEDADLHDLRYAALDVRLAIEALTYSRAQALEKELPPSEIGTWQPRRLIALLRDLDPLSAGGMKIEVAKGPPGSPLENEFFELGAEQPLTMTTVKAHYDRVGNRLHMPTLRQLATEGAPDAAQLRAQLRAAIADLDAVLASTVFDVNLLALRPHHRCERCGYRIREPDALPTGPVICRECRLTYDLTAKAGGGISWNAQRASMKCGTAECGETLTTYTADLKPGLEVACTRCRGVTVVVFGARAPRPDR